MINSQAAHAFTVALLETFYEEEGKRISDDDVMALLKEAGVTKYIEADDFAMEYEEEIWTEENEMKFGGIHCDNNGYFLMDPDDVTDDEED